MQLNIAKSMNMVEIEGLNELIEKDSLEHLKTATITQDQRGKLNSHYGKKHSKETKQLLSEIAKKRPIRKGWKHTDKSKEKMSKSRKGRKNPEASKRMQGNTLFKGKKHSEETKQKMSKPRLHTEKMKQPKKELQCPICGYKGRGASNMYRWHFDNCRYGN